MRHPRDRRHDDGFLLLAAAARLWSAGVPLDWNAFHGAEHRRRVSLPGYPFERRRHWIEAPGTTETVEPTLETQIETLPSGAAADLAAPEGPIEETVAALFREQLGVEELDVEASFFDLSGDSLTAVRIVSRLERNFSLELSVEDLFKHPTVRHLSAWIEEKLVEKIEALPEDEAERLVAELAD
jgi:acyl carrier protein